jgi:hypothetical protein
VKALWCDAVCIKQTDDSEKAAQIVITAQIFATAKNVLVWLGPEQERDVVAFTTMIAYDELCGNTKHNPAQDLQECKIAFASMIEYIRYMSTSGID